MDSTEASLQPERIFVDEKWEEFLRQTDGAKGYSPSALTFARHAFETGVQRGVFWRITVESKSTPPRPLQQAKVQQTPDWRSMSTAPKNATWVDVRMADGTVHRAHWACDMSGEEQPAFKGWFIKLTPQSRDFTGIPDPVAWRPAS